MGFHSHRRGGARRREGGYILLTLLLTMALMIIFAVAIVSPIKFQIERDREDELIHRGVQYSRAIRAYYKKFGRYPVKLEDLESTNQQRFLRKRYKDPITGQDFKLLHFGEVKLTFGGGIGGGSIPGASPIGGAGGANGSGGLGQISPLGASSGPNSSFGANSGLGSNSSSGVGSNSLGGNQANQQPGNSQTPGSDSSQASSGGTGSNGPGSDNSSGPGSNSSGSSGDQLSGQVFGGGPIVGVVSTSKKDTIREFNHKKKYNEWQFIYDPGTDRGGLLMTPNQPPIQGFGPPGTQNPNGQVSGSVPSGTMSPGPQNNQSPSAPTPPPDPNNPQQPQQ